MMSHGGTQQKRKWTNIRETMHRACHDVWCTYLSGLEEHQNSSVLSKSSMITHQYDYCAKNTLVYE